MPAAAADAAHSRVQLMMMVIRQRNFGKSSHANGRLSIHPSGKLYATSPRLVTVVICRRRSSPVRVPELFYSWPSSSPSANHRPSRHGAGTRLADAWRRPPASLIRHVIAVNWCCGSFFIFHSLQDVNGFCRVLARARRRHRQRVCQSVTRRYWLKTNDRTITQFYTGYSLGTLVFFIPTFTL